MEQPPKISNLNMVIDYGMKLSGGECSLAALRLAESVLPAYEAATSDDRVRRALCSVLERPDVTYLVADIADELHREFQTLTGSANRRATLCGFSAANSAKFALYNLAEPNFDRSYGFAQAAYYAAMTQSAIDGWEPTPPNHQWDGEFNWAEVNRVLLRVWLEDVLGAKQDNLIQQWFDGLPNANRVISDCLEEHGFPRIDVD